MIESEKKFDFIEHTADTGLIAYGRTLPEVFENAAAGMFSLICEPDSVTQSSTREIKAHTDDGNPETLLVEWLNELLYIFDVDYFLLGGFHIYNFDNSIIKAKCSGEAIDLKKHTIKTEIKAATYHMLNISKDKDTYQAGVIFDV